MFRLPTLALSSVCALMFVSPMSAAESNPRIQRAIDTFAKEAVEADAQRDEEVEKAQLEHAKSMEKARSTALRNLKRLVNSRSDVSTQAEVYKAVLRLDPYDKDATKFFTAIGTIDQVLNDLDPLVKTDLLGNITTTDSVVAGAQLTESQARELLALIPEMSQDNWDELQGVEFPVSAGTKWNQFEGAEIGRRVLVVAAPDDRWGQHGQQMSALGVDIYNAYFSLRMRVGENGQESIRRGSIVTIPEVGLWFGANDGDPEAWYHDNEGSVRVKLFLIR